MINRIPSIYLTKNYLIMTNPKYQVFRKREDGQFYFILNSADGEIVLESDAHACKKACLEEISSIRIIARFDSNFTRVNHGFLDFSFLLEAGNGEIIAKCEGYHDTSAREDAIYAVKRDAVTAPVEDLS